MTDINERAEEILRYLPPGDTAVIKAWVTSRETLAQARGETEGRALSAAWPVAILSLALIGFGWFTLFIWDSERVALAKREAVTPIEARAVTCENTLRAVEYACVEACALEPR